MRATTALGDTAKTGTVFLGQDSQQEPDEFLPVKLSDPRGATIADGEDAMTIIDDDA